MSDQTTPTLAEQAAVDRACAALDEAAEVWAKAAGLTRMIAVILERDDRESRLEGLVKLAWGEGAYAGQRGLSLAEIEELGRGR